MKKIYLLIFTLVCIPFLGYAQTTGNVCTGEIRTNLADAQACADKAEAQGRALGYNIECNVERLGLGGFVDPTSNQDYILNGVCTVNGSTGHGAYLLAGFQASSGSNAVIQSVNPGWQILKTELEFQNASNQCGGNTPYYVNGAYTCTRPPQPEPLPITGTTKTNLSSSPEVLAGATYQSIIDSVRRATERVLARYQVYARESLNLNLNVSPSALLGAGSSGTTPSNQCHSFTQTIKAGDTGPDVLALTTALRQEGLLSYTTSLFTAEVMTAVKRLQEKHATEILSILGLTQGTGLVGDRTRAYLNTQCIKPDTAGSVATGGGTVPPTTPSSSCVAPRSAIKNGKYQYTFTKVVGGNWTVTLNNPAFRTPSDPYYVPANVSFSAPDARDLNRQNQGRFNYLQSLPGTPEGNTEYANLFGSFNNAYYDWDVMTKDVVCTTSAVPSPTSPSPSPTSPASFSNQIRYIKISVADWDTLPLALREITVIGANNTTIRPVSISVTDFDRPGYQPPSYLLDGNENTIWRATKSAPTCAKAGDPGIGRGDSIGGGRTCEVFGDLQVITLDLGTATAVDRVSIMNYGFTDTRVVVIEVSENGNSYTQIAEVRAQVSAPIADKGAIMGVVRAATTVGPIQY